MKIAILDYCVGDVTVKDVPENLRELDGDDILTEMGYRAADVEYMIIDNELPLSIETEECKLKLNLK